MSFDKEYYRKCMDSFNNVEFCCQNAGGIVKDGKCVDPESESALTRTAGSDASSES